MEINIPRLILILKNKDKRLEALFDKLGEKCSERVDPLNCLSASFYIGDACKNLRTLQGKLGDNCHEYEKRQEIYTIVNPEELLAGEIIFERQFFDAALNLIQVKKVSEKKIDEILDWLHLDNNFFQIKARCSKKITTISNSNDTKMLTEEYNENNGSSKNNNDLTKTGKKKNSTQLHIGFLNFKLNINVKKIITGILPNSQKPSNENNDKSNNLMPIIISFVNGLIIANFNRIFATLVPIDNLDDTSKVMILICLPIFSIVFGIFTKKHIGKKRKKIAIILWIICFLSVIVLFATIILKIFKISLTLS